jgi:hypothetical protein
MRINRGKPDSAVSHKIDELKEVDERISAIAEDDPLGALFIVKNLHVEGGLDEKPLVAKIVLSIAEKLDAAIRHGYAEKAKVYKSLVVKLAEELDVKDIYGSIILPSQRAGEGAEEKDELLEDVSLEESIAAVRAQEEPRTGSR